MPREEEDEDAHSQIIGGLYEQYEELFEESDQGLYIYLDDLNKVCNQRFASMLGYKSPREWAAVKENFPTTFVAPGSQRSLVESYQRAVSKGSGSSIKVEWKKKTGGTLKTDVIVVPIPAHGHRAALHFVTKSYTLDSR